MSFHDPMTNSVRESAGRPNGSRSKLGASSVGVLGWGWRGACHLKAPAEHYLMALVRSCSEAQWYLPSGEGEIKKVRPPLGNTPGSLLAVVYGGVGVVE